MREIDNKGVRILEIDRMLREKFRIGLYGCFMVCLLLLACNVFHITSRVAGLFFPEYDITNEMIQNGAVDLIDWKLLPNGDMISTSVDPMIAVYFERSDIDVLRLYCMDVFMQDGLEGYSEAWWLPNYQLQGSWYTNGNLHIVLEKNRLDNVGIRIDLFDENERTVHIENIIFNANQTVTKRFQDIFLAFFFFAFLVGMICLVRTVVLKRKYIFDWVMLVSCLVWLCIAAFICCFLYVDFASGSFTVNIFYIVLLLVVAVCMLEKNIAPVIPVILMQIMHFYALYIIGGESVYTALFHYSNDPLMYLNLLFDVGAVLCIQCAVGKNIGGLISSICTALYLTANLVKIRYQNNVFGTADLKLWREVIKISGQFLSPQIILTFVILFCVVIGIVIWRFSWFKEFFRPRIGWRSLGAFLGLALLLYLITADETHLHELEIRPDNVAYNTISADGFSVYSWLELTGQNKAQVPAGYSEGVVAAAEMVASGNVYLAENAIRPTVILILAESIFEVEKIPNVYFDQEIFAELTPYRVANNISPSYGGRTAAAEWESLTGLSDLFLVNDELAYTSYLKTDKRTTGSLAREFAENGYHTVAIHANVETYYGRNTVYANMGFDDFVSKEDFVYTEESIVGDTFVKDDVFVDEILVQEEATDGPLFVFGATIESHADYLNKYDEITVNAYSDVYSDYALKEVAAYAQAAYHTDQALGRLIRYYEQSDQPVLIYIYGDHLPALTIHAEDGYLNNAYLKYSTPLFAYSNYTDVSVKEEYLSTSYIATEIIRKSGIAHRAYFDAIYQIRQEYPIVHKEFVTDTASDALQLYRQITWDLTEGERYLLK